MKLNAFSTICAVLTLMLCIILGAIFGTTATGGSTVDTACAANVQQTVANCRR